MIESIEPITDTADVPRPNSGERRRSGRIAKSSRAFSQSPEPSPKTSCSPTPPITNGDQDRTKHAANANSSNSLAASSVQATKRTEHFKTDSLKDIKDIEDTTPSPSKKDGRFEQTEIVSTASLSKENSEGELEQATPDDPSKSTPSSARESSQDQKEEMNARNSDPPSPLGKRKRLERAGRPNQIPSEDPSCVEYLMTPLSEDERVEWKGWAEIESEPALFDYILKQHGVKNIKVTELTGVTDEVLNDLPKPVHGLIFLYNYRDDGGDEEDLPKAPKHLWFANQVATNSCATVAMLNILMNVPGIELGDTLKTFKESTRLKKPPFRGRDLANNAAIRVTHNSFVRRVDVLNSDLILEQDFEKWEKLRKSKKRKVVNNRKTTKKEKKADEEPAFHFIAYVPLNNEVWRLDGLQNQPINLGCATTGSWLALARDNIVAHMSRYPDSQSYNFMALCTSPLLTLQQDLAANSCSLISLESTLSTLNPTWRSFLASASETSSPPRELDESFGVSPSVIAAASPKEKDRKRVEEAGQDMEVLMSVYADLVAEQKRLQVMYIEEVNNGMEEDEKAEKAKRDFSPFVYRVIKEMAEDGSLRKVWSEFEDRAL